MTDRIRIDLTDLQDIMDELPDPATGGENRKHSLTKNDIMLIARIVTAVSHKTCAVGFTPDEIVLVKRLVGTMNKGILLVGYAILGAVTSGAVAVIGTVTWWTIKHGIIELSKGASK